MTAFQSAPITRKAGPHGALFAGAVRRALYGIGLFSAAINVLALTGVFFMLQIYDRMPSSDSLPTPGALSLLAAALFAICGLLDLVQHVTVTYWPGARPTTKIQTKAARFPASLGTVMHADMRIRRYAYHQRRQGGRPGNRAEGHAGSQQGGETITPVHAKSL